MSNPKNSWLAAFWRLARLARKELRETLRDRRTILTLVLMPVLVYPLLSIGFRQIFLNAAQTLIVGDVGGGTGNAAMDSQVRIVVATRREQDELDKFLVQSQRWIERQKQSSGNEGRETTANEPAFASIATDIATDLEAALHEGRADVGLKIEEAQGADASDLPLMPRFSIYFRPKSSHSRDLAMFLERRLHAWNELQARVQLASLGQEKVSTAVWRVHEVDEAAEDTISLASLIPLVLILMTITGAVYPSIDLTAGERERGTLEALMAAPVPRLQLLLAKYIAVLTVALMTAIVNLTAMLSTIYGGSLQHLVFGERGLSWLAIGQVLLLLLLFAAFFSALLLALTSFARSFKEAQAYLIPLMLVSLAPGFLTIMPNLKMNYGWAITPLANIALLARDVLQDKVQTREAILAVFSSVLYAMAALGVAAKVFGSDSILYGSTASWGDLLRKPDKRPVSASMVGALLVLALLFPLQVLLKGLLLGKALEMNLFQLFRVSAVMTVLIYGIFPALLALLQHVPLKFAFQIRSFRWQAIIAAILLGCAMWPWCHEIVVVLAKLGVAPVSGTRLAQMVVWLKEFNRLPPWFVVLCLGVIPGVCEEWFFRGFLQGAMVKRLGGPWGVVAAAAAFGLFHVLSEEQLTLVRLLPSTLMGLVLGLICWRSGSVIPGMVLHVLHNSLLVLAARYKDELGQFVAGAVELPSDRLVHLPLSWLAMSAVSVGLGLLICWKLTPSISSAADEQLAEEESLRGEVSMSSP